MKQVQRQQLQQKFSPQQIQLMRLLQLPVTDLEQAIKEEAEKNPLLEVEEQDVQPLPDNDQSDWDSDEEEDFDYDYREHLEVTHKTLEGIISKDTPRIRVFNKAEICDEARRTELRENYPEAIQVSARENIGMERLRETFKEQLAAWHKKREAHEQKEKERSEAPWRE